MAVGNLTNVIADPNRAFFTPSGIEQAFAARGDLGTALGLGALRSRQLRQFLPILQANNLARGQLAQQIQRGNVFGKLATSEPFLSRLPNAGTFAAAGGQANTGVPTAVGSDAGARVASIDSANAGLIPGRLADLVASGFQKSVRGGAVPQVGAVVNPAQGVSGIPQQRFNPAGTPAAAAAAAGAAQGEVKNTTVEKSVNAAGQPTFTKVETKGKGKAATGQAAGSKAVAALRAVQKNLREKGASKAASRAHVGKVGGKEGIIIPFETNQGERRVFFDPDTGKTTPIK